MKGQMHVYYAKGLFKNAVAVGAGLVVGKYLGGCITTGIGEVGKIALKLSAKIGNESAQEACNKLNLEYEKKLDNDDSDKVTMGFHCE